MIFKTAEELTDQIRIVLKDFNTGSKAIKAMHKNLAKFGDVENSWDH